MLVAEREGFEPPEVLPSTVFKTAAIDHSAISPLWFALQRYKLFLILQNNLSMFAILRLSAEGFLGGETGEAEQMYYGACMSEDEDAAVW